MGSKHDYETRIAKMSVPIFVKICVCSEKLTHFYMSYDAEIWQTYIKGPPKPEGIMRNPENFAPVCLKWGMKSAVITYMSKLIKLIRFE
jgi:hypothetical protein